MIKIHRISSMGDTPFNRKPVAQKDRQILEENKIVFTEKIEESDILISQNANTLIRYRCTFGFRKKFLLWTPEPRQDSHLRDKIRGFLLYPDIHVMNVYTGSIFTNNFTFPFCDNFFRDYWKIDPLDFLNEENCPYINRKIAILASYRNDKQFDLKVKNKNIDLSCLRSQIALKGHDLGIMDIYGGSWPEGVSISNSRLGQWYEVKKEILKNYNFNLCFENTNYDYYCTEKIWDSIRYGCLPIYYGNGNRIYEDFPKV
jgi:hypothetical protein